MRMEGKKDGKETEKAKERYDKATMKLHVLHNQYVLALKGAQLHQSQYYDTTLPLLLDSLQKMQEEMIKALKGIFDEYSQITSLVTEEIVNVHKEIQMSVEQIDPSTEYNNFIDVHRTTAAKEQEIEFDTSLLEENENLQANEIMWNNLTAESLQVIESACHCRRRGCSSWASDILWEGNGNPLLYSRLGNPMDKEAWQASVHGVAKRQIFATTKIFHLSKQQQQRYLICLLVFVRNDRN